MVGEAGVLDRDAAHAAQAEGPAQQHEALGETAADQHLVAGGTHTAHPAQVGGERGAQLPGAARLGVEQAAVGHLAQDVAGMAKPVVPGEQCRVGQPARRGGAVAAGGHRPERHGPVRRALRAAAGASPDPGTRSAAGLQVSLGHELLVGPGHDRARHVQLAGQDPRGRQRGARAE